MSETIAGRAGPRAKPGDWHHWEDEELAVAAALDLDAFGELVRRHQDFVYGAALRIVRNPAIAEELAQETFIRAHRGLAAFRGDAHVRSWLYRIATNLAKNAVTRTREHAAERVPEVVSHRGPAHALEQKRLREDIEAAVRRLPEHLRGPFVMREYEHMSYKDIARATGLRLNTVRTRILRARRVLRDELEEWR